MYANKMPKDVRNWMKEHTVKDLEVDYFNSKSDNTMVQEIISVLYDLGIYEGSEAQHPVAVAA